MRRMSDLQRVADRLRDVRPEYIVATAALLLLLVDTFIKPLSVVAVGLLVVALSPWLFKFMKTLELPGGIKIEFREKLEKVTEEAREAGLLNPQTTETRTYEALYNEDPTLALAGLRIELERRIRELVKVADMGEHRVGILRQLNLLRDRQILDPREVGVISDLVPLLNSAVHSEEFGREAADWAMHIGPALLAGLDRKIAEIDKGGVPN